MSPWHWAIVGIIALAIIGASRATTGGSDSKYSEKGVTVNFKKSTITINGSRFNVAEVRGIRLQGTIVTIIVNDMKKPERKVTFWSTSNASRFYQRLSIALERCGQTMAPY
jgi:hypothetical protein